MRYAVLSDIHSNLEALTAVLEVLAKERIDQYFCLGDMVGYGADPVACWSRLEELKAIMVAGNHEWACIGKMDDRSFNDAARLAIQWTRDQLGCVELDALRRLPLTTSEGPFTLAHATLRQPSRFDYLVDLGQAVDTLKSCRTLFCLVGHTHVAFVVEYDRSANKALHMLTRPEELADVSFRNEPGQLRYLINPGSVGQPRDGDPQASVAVVDTDAKRLSIRRIPYDIQTAARKIRDAGLPLFLAERLTLGR